MRRLETMRMVGIDGTIHANQNVHRELKHTLDTFGMSNLPSEQKQVLWHLQQVIYVDEPHCSAYFSLRHKNLGFLYSGIWSVRCMYMYWGSLVPRPPLFLFFSLRSV